MSAGPNNSPNSGNGNSGGGTPGAPKGKGKRIVTLKLSLATLISSGLALLLGIVWVFILGVIIGRGQAGKILKNGASSTQSSASAQKPAITQTPVTGTAAGDPVNDILGSEDLQYRDSLRRTGNSKPTSVPMSTPGQIPPVAPAANTAAPATPLAAQTAPVNSTPAPTTPSSPTAPALATAPNKVPNPTAPLAAPNSAEEFDYVYQVAAFKEEQQAAKAAAKLKKAGINTSIESSRNTDGSTWYRVLTPFRGTAESTQILKNALAAQGVPQVMQRSKTPVPAKR